MAARIEKMSTEQAQGPVEAGLEPPLARLLGSLAFESAPRPGG
jgi:hypothetical protein